MAGLQGRVKHPQGSESPKHAFLIRAEDITAISSSESAERRSPREDREHSGGPAWPVQHQGRPLRRRSGRSLLRGFRPLSTPVLALPVEPSRPPNEVDELVAELAEAQELQKKMSQLLSMVSHQGEQGVVEVEEVEVEAVDDAVLVLEAEPEDPSANVSVPGPEKNNLTDGPADCADPPEDPPQEAAEGLEFEGSESEDTKRAETKMLALGCC